MKNKKNYLNLSIYDSDLVKNLKNFKEANGMTWDTTLSLLIGQSHSMRWQAMDLEVKRMVGWAEVIFQDRPDVVQALSSSLSIILNPRVHDTPSLMARLCQDLDALHRSLLQDLSLPPPQTPPPGVRPKK